MSLDKKVVHLFRFLLVFVGLLDAVEVVVAVEGTVVVRLGLSRLGGRLKRSFSLELCSASSVTNKAERGRNSHFTDLSDCQPFPDKPLKL